ncbi:MAG: hypothetical protein V7K92_14700 [Nostoc sp.]
MHRSRRRKRCVKPAAWQLLETLRVACFPAGVRLERVLPTARWRERAS